MWACASSSLGVGGVARHRARSISDVSPPPSHRPHTSRASAKAASKVDGLGPERTQLHGQKWEGVSAWLADEATEKIRQTLHDVRKRNMQYWKTKRADHWQGKQQPQQPGYLDNRLSMLALLATRMPAILVGQPLEPPSSPDRTDTSATKPAAPATNSAPETPASMGLHEEKYLNGTVGLVVDDVVKYGEMVQAVYDTLLTKDVYSQYFGNCVPGVMVPGQALKQWPKSIAVQSAAGEYKVITRMQADAGAYRLVAKKGRNYVGIIALGPGAEQNQPVDVAIVFRGTITQDEWVQDAKAFKVCWRGGRQAVDPPVVLLKSSPFLGDSRVFLWTFIATLLLLNSNSGSSTVQALHSLADSITAMTTSGTAAQGAAAILWQLLTTISSPFVAGYYAAVGLLVSFLDFLQVNPAEVPILSDATVTGLTAFVVWGVFAGLLNNPDEWLTNVGKSVAAMPVCIYFLVGTCLDAVGLLGVSWNAPRVSYGFKEMYSDAKEGLQSPQKLVNSVANLIQRPPQPGQGPRDLANQVWDQLKHSVLPGSQLVKEQPIITPKVLAQLKGELQSSSESSQPSRPGSPEALDLRPQENPSLSPSPRLTVYQTLVELMEHGIKIKSITITGHSLGGALASMCGYDLSDAIKEALENTAAVAAKPQDKESLYDKTDAKRSAFIKQLQDLPGGPNSVSVGVVTFAAPRVGDEEYTKAFNGHSLMCPMGVIEPIWDCGYEPGIWSKISVLVRDNLIQLAKMPWYIVGVLQQTLQVEMRSAKRPRVGMLRVANAHDFVPNLPITLPLPPLMYVHGGHELLLNSYLDHYFKTGVTGATIGARHNLEMHLHMLDPRRDKPLVNKSDDLLAKECKVPACWWDPVPHKGMRLVKGKWVRPE